MQEKPFICEYCPPSYRQPTHGKECAAYCSSMTYLLGPVIIPKSKPRALLVGRCTSLQRRRQKVRDDKFSLHGLASDSSSTTCQLIVDHAEQIMGSGWSEHCMTPSQMRSRGQCLFYKLYNDLRASIRRLIPVTSMAVVVNNPYVVDPLFLQACSPETDGPEADAMPDNAKMLNTLSACQRWAYIDASLHDSGR